MATTGGSAVKSLGEKYRRILTDSNGDLVDITKDNFRGVFSSKGADIGGSWKGNDLVNTGRLRTLLTGGSGIKVQDGKISVNLPTGYLFLNDRYKFLGVSTESLGKISSLFTGRGETPGA